MGDNVEHSIDAKDARALVASLQTALHYLWCARMTEWLRGGKRGEEPSR